MFFHDWRKYLAADFARRSSRRKTQSASGYVLLTQQDSACNPMVETLEGRTLLSVDPVLVRDLVIGAGGSDPSHFANVNGTLFFSANDGVNGEELWRSDGTSAGTTLVKDIRSGSEHSYPSFLTNVNGTLYFRALGDENGEELWRSDGTSAGTTLVKDIRSGNGKASPRYLTNVNGTLFFNAHDGVNGEELWRSDGTSSGTTLVKDIASGSGSSFPRSLTNVDGTLFFNAHDGVNGEELWSSNGTSVGTTLVKDINGVGHSRPSYLTNVNGTLFFNANDGTNGYELWQSDGTSSGTRLVRDIVSGSGSLSPRFLTNVNGTLFFNGNDGTNDYELWQSDGTSSGTTLVKDIFVFTGSSSSFPSFLTNVNGTLFFSAADGVNGRELWQSDGTSAGTRLVKDIRRNGHGSSFPSYLTNVNGTLFFSANDGVNGYELWSMRVNSRPQLTNIESSSLPYAPNGAATSITSTLALTDADQTTMSGATVRISTGFQSGDVLEFANFGNITGSYDSNGTLTLSGNDTVARYQTALRRVKYSSSSASPQERVVSFEVNDGLEPSNVVTRSIGGTAQLVGTTLNVYGTSSADVIAVSEAESVTVVVNGTPFSYAPEEIMAMNIFGFAGSDTITINSLIGVAVTADGGDDNDTLNVLNSVRRSVTLLGGNGNDTLIGGRGSDTLKGGAGDDMYVFRAATSAEADLVTELGNQGTDTLSFATLTTAVKLSLGTSAVQNVHTNRTLKLNSSLTFENAVGGSGNDTLTGNSLANTLTGNSGNDRLTGAAGNDVMLGGKGNDTYAFANASSAEADLATEYSNQGTDTLTFSTVTSAVNVNLASNSVRTIHTNRTLKLNSFGTFENAVGGSGNDTLTGNSLANTLTGNDGNDRLTGAAGNDVMLGGKGNDTYAFANASSAEADRVTEYSNQGTDTLTFSTVTSALNVNLASNSVRTIHTNRTLKLNSSLTFENAVGGSGNDTLTGNSSANILTGNDGNDRLTGAAGNDVMLGGKGNDTYAFANASSAEADLATEYSNQGTDTLTFSTVTSAVNVNLASNSVRTIHTNRTLKLNSFGTFENAVGGSGNDTLTGNSLANTLTGNDGNDRLTGAAGNDVMLGGKGNDTYAFANASSAEADRVTEYSNQGTDTLTFNSVTAAVNLNLGTSSVQTVHIGRTLRLNSDATVENVYGGSGADFLRGNARNNLLNGGTGHDILVGENGNDQLVGGTGRDILIGGLGLDTINGGSDDDILIAGRTTSSVSVSRLDDIRTEWISARSYAARIINVRASVGASSASLKAKVNVVNDGGEDDSLNGSSGNDWYFRALDDVITGLLSSEAIDLL